VLRRCVWSRNIKNRCSIYIYIYIYDISSLRVNLRVSAVLFLKKINLRGENLVPCWELWNRGSPRNPLIFYIWNRERTNNKHICSSAVSVPCFLCWLYWSSTAISVFLKPSPIVGCIYAHVLSVRTLPLQYDACTKLQMNGSWCSLAHSHTCSVFLVTFLFKIRSVEFWRFLWPLPGFIGRLAPLKGLGSSGP